MRRTFFIHRKFQGQNEGFGEKTGFLSGPVSSHPILELNDKLFSRRQGLLEGTWCLDTNEGLSPGQAAEIDRVYAAYPHLGPVLPAVGYFPEQIAALEQTINDSDADVVVAGTPIDLNALIEVRMPVVRARYEFADASTPTLDSLVDGFLEQL